MRTIGIVGEVTIGIGSASDPQWPVNIVGSISHTHGAAGAIVAQAGGTRGLGLDLEHVVTPEVGSAVQDIVLDANELAVLSVHFSDNLLLGLTIAFSAKESLYKAVFAQVGAFFSFDAAIVRDVDTTSRTLQLSLSDELAPSLPAGARFQAHYDVISPELIVTLIAC